MLIAMGRCLERSSNVISLPFLQVTYHVLPWDSRGRNICSCCCQLRLNEADFTFESCRSVSSFTPLWNFQVAQFSLTSYWTHTLPICGVRCSEASWETFAWPAQDADQSWILVLYFWEEKRQLAKASCSFWGTKLPWDTMRHPTFAHPPLAVGEAFLSNVHDIIEYLSFWDAPSQPSH